MTTPLKLAYGNRMGLQGRKSLKRKKILPKPFFQSKLKENEESFEEVQNKTSSSISTNTFSSTFRRCKSTMSLRIPSKRNQKEKSENKKTKRFPLDAGLASCSTSFNLPACSPSVKPASFYFQEKLGKSKKPRNVFTRTFRKTPSKKNKFSSRSVENLHRISKNAPQLDFASSDDIASLRWSSKNSKIKKTETKRNWWKNVSLKTPNKNPNRTPRKNQHISVASEEKANRRKKSQFPSTIFRDGLTKDATSGAADSLHHVLKNKSEAQCFRKFLQKEFNEENLDFWLDVERYKKLSERKRRKSAGNIYNTYVAANSQKEINIDAETRKAMKEKLLNPDKTTFDTAQKYIFNLMEKDPYRRFLDTSRRRSLC